MKKVWKFLLLGLIGCWGIGVGSSFGLPEAQAAIKQPSSQGVLFDKRCEKCKRGKDGKMVCVPVPCP